MKTQITNAYSLTTQALQEAGYQWWWHSFTAHHRETKVAKTFYIQYAIMNPGLGGDEPQFYSETSQQPAYAAISVGTFGDDACEMTQYYGTQSFQAHQDRLQIVIGEAYGDDTNLFGEIAVTEAHTNPQVPSALGSVIWNLRVNKRLSYAVPTTKVPRIKKQVASKGWQADGMYTEYAGTIVYNGEVYDVMPTTSYGYQDTNWGTELPTPWLFLNCNNFQNPITGLHANLTSLVVNAIPNEKNKKVSLERKVIIAFSHQGQLYEYNPTKLIGAAKQDVSCLETATTIEWHIVAMTKESRIEIQFSCPKTEVLPTVRENAFGGLFEQAVVSGANGTGTVKLFEMKEKEYKLIASFTGQNMQCSYESRD
ncbi:MAG: tocopherol cyclase family protein [Culicoidibacterales bacterium]